MDYEAYRSACFADPAPKPRFAFTGAFGVTLYDADFSAAADFYAQILGPPAYVEGAGTRGWPAGDGWLTLLQGRQSNPQNVDVTLQPTRLGSMAVFFWVKHLLGYMVIDDLIRRMN